MGEIHELFVLALSLVWFAGSTPDCNVGYFILQGFLFKTLRKTLSNEQEYTDVYHTGNYYKILPRNNCFCNALGIYYKIIPPEHFLCNVAATGLSLFAREHAKECAL